MQYWALKKKRKKVKWFLFDFVFQEKHFHTTEFLYENLVATVLNLYLAGTETTSSTIRFALNVLIKYPKVQGGSQKPVWQIHTLASNDFYIKYIF